MSADNLPILHVVSGVIQNPEGLYFVALRPPHVPFSGVWEFPGGKIEPGESAYEALVRELQEEVGIQVHAARPLLQFEHTYPARIINMSAWSIDAFEGEPHGAEGQEFDWVNIDKLLTLTFPDANYTLIHHLTSRTHLL
ncbi:MAG: 8-oxo-dGTP diphosphatase MutT [Gammaproteobacteria bacterium]|nr:8-oxo-dGTP diphosphatase MutT [Gammaproteobacteria bacterium]